jgi:hypothetical protein
LAGTQSPLRLLIIDFIEKLVLSFSKRRQIALLRERIVEFALYVGLIIKEFIKWILIPGGILGLLFLFRIIKIEIPSFIFWLIGCIGLVCASYRIYKVQQKEVPPGKDIIKLKRQARVSVSLVDSNKFGYLLDEGGIALVLRALPVGTVILHTKILNTGPSDAEILSIKGEFYPHDLWFVDYQSLAQDNNQNELIFPRRLPSHDRLFGDLFFPVKPNPTLNQAQIKDRLLKHQKKEVKLKFRLHLEFRDATEKTHSIWLEDKISSERLIEMYLKKLHELEGMIASFHR